MHMQMASKDCFQKGAAHRLEFGLYIWWFNIFIVVEIRSSSSTRKTTKLQQCVVALSTSVTITLKTHISAGVIYKKKTTARRRHITSYSESKPKCYWTLLTSHNHILLTNKCIQFSFGNCCHISTFWSKITSASSVKTDFSQLQRPWQKDMEKKRKDAEVQEGQSSHKLCRMTGKGRPSRGCCGQTARKSDRQSTVPLVKVAKLKVGEWPTSALAGWSQ